MTSYLHSSIIKYSEMSNANSLLTLENRLHLYLDSYALDYCAVTFWVPELNMLYDFKHMGSHQ